MMSEWLVVLLAIVVVGAFLLIRDRGRRSSRRVPAGNDTAPGADSAQIHVLNHRESVRTNKQTPDGAHYGDDPSIGKPGTVSAAPHVGQRDGVDDSDRER